MFRLPLPATLAFLIAAATGCDSSGTPQKTTMPNEPAVVIRETTRPASESDPVRITLRQTTAGEQQAIEVACDLRAGYEMQSRDAEKPLVATTFDLSLPAGTKTVGDWSRPATAPSAGALPHDVYSGRVVFTQPITGDASGPVECVVRYQICDAERCLRPTSASLTLPAEAASD